MISTFLGIAEHRTGETGRRQIAAELAKTLAKAARSVLRYIPKKRKTTRFQAVSERERRDSNPRPPA